MLSTVTTYTKNPTTIVISVINYLHSIIQFLLGLRFFLRLAGANSNNVFVSAIYSFSDVLLVPFRGVFKTSVVEGSVFEWSILFAMAIYAILAYGLMQLFLLLSPQEEVTEVSKVTAVDEEHGDL